MTKLHVWATALTVGMFAALPASAAHLRYFTSSLDGAQQVPPNMSASTGGARLTVDTTAEALSFSLGVNGISLDNLWDDLVASPVGPIHLHNNTLGNNGPVIVPFAFNMDDYTATTSGFNLSVTDFSYADAIATSGSSLSFDDFLTALNDDAIYINVHTDTFNGGEIRGQVAAVPLPAGAFLLFGGLAGLAAMRRKQKSATA